MAAKSSDKSADKTTNEASKANAARERDLEAAISTITKSYGDGAIMRLGDAHAQKKIEVIPTSTMPKGLLDARTRREVEDLLAYLARGPRGG